MADRLQKLGNLKNVENINYEGRDSLDYEDFLMIFLAESTRTFIGECVMLCN